MKWLRCLIYLMNLFMYNVNFKLVRGPLGDVMEWLMILVH